MQTEACIFSLVFVTRHITIGAISSAAAAAAAFTFFSV